MCRDASLENVNNILAKGEKVKQNNKNKALCLLPKRIHKLCRLHTKQSFEIVSKRNCTNTEYRRIEDIFPSPVASLRSTSKICLLFYFSSTIYVIWTFFLLPRPSIRSCCRLYIYCCCVLQSSLDESFENPCPKFLVKITLPHFSFTSFAMLSTLGICFTLLLP